MQQEFIPYTEALAMKELGFNERCLGCHVDTTGGYCFTDYMSPHTREALIRAGNEFGFSPTIHAPLYQQAFRYFREKYKLEGEVHCIRFNSKRLKGYQYAITYNNYQSFKQCGDLDTYEEAQLECLKQLIKIVQDGGVGEGKSG